MYITGDQLPTFSLFLTHLVAVWSWQLADLYCNIKANTSTYLSLSSQSGVQAVNKRPPELPILCLCFQLVPGDAHRLGLCQEVSALGVSWPAYSPFLLGVPRQCLSCGTSHRLPKHVPYPSSFPPSYFPFCWGLLCSLPQADIADLIWPVQSRDSPEAAVDEGLYFCNGSFCYPPCLCTME